MRVFHEHSGTVADVRTRAARNLQAAANSFVDISYAAAHHGIGRIAIEARTYERFVEWNSSAMRRLGVHLDPQARLDALLGSCRHAACSRQGGCFVCRAVDACGQGTRPRRHVFELTNRGTKYQPAWLIHC